MKRFSRKTIIALVLTFTAAIAVSLSIFILPAAASEPIEFNGYFYTVSNNEVTIRYVDDTVVGDVTVPSTLGGYPVTSIGASAFSGRSYITAVELPSSVNKIGDNAFSGCSNLTSINIPSSVTSIGSYAFHQCHALLSITIPSSVTAIGERAFDSCIKLARIDVAAANPNYCSIGGVLFNKANTVLIQAPAGFSGNFTIPNTVSSIGAYAFYFCSGLTGIELPPSLKSIGDYAFAGCDGLASITLPTSLESIGARAFNNCTALTAIDISSYVSSIGPAAFATLGELRSINVAAGNPNYCSVGGVLYNKSKTVLMQMPAIYATGSFVIPDTVTRIGELAFYTNIRRVEIPVSVNTIDDYAFSYTRLLTDVYYTGSEDSWNQIAVNLDYHNASLADATIHFNSKMPECFHGSFSDVVDERYLKTEANCTYSAVYYKSCTNCGEPSEETFQSGAFAPDNHDFRPDMIQGPDTHYYDCTRCHVKKDEAPHKYIYTSYNGTHLGFCSCGKATELMECSGGEATCNAKAICEVCTGAYGNFDNNNHDYREDMMQGETTHYYLCNRCNHRKDEAAHEYTKDCVSYGGTHSVTCKCGKTELQNCSGGEANCTERAKCEVCGGNYGDTDESNHDYSPDLIEGYDTHYYECGLCFVKKSEAAHKYGDYSSTGRDSHSAMCICGKVDMLDCFGGEATCMEPAVCEVCRSPYGHVNANNHNYSPELIQGASVHYYECSYCKRSKDAALHEYPNSYVSLGDGTHASYCICGKAKIISCSGGAATCTERALCDVCKAPYGNVDMENHSYSPLFIQGDTTHYYECIRCNARKSESLHEYKNYISSESNIHKGTCRCGKTDVQYCSGDDSSATCQAKALCAVCGTEYGSFAPHDYDVTVWSYKNHDGHAHMCRTEGCYEYDTVIKHTSGGEATEDSAEECTVCGYIIESATGHIRHTPAEDWSKDADNHWKSCTGCSEQRLEIGTHIYDNDCDTECDTCGYIRTIEHNYINLKYNETRHWYECACGAEEVGSRGPHIGLKSTCTETAICVHCSAPYGEKNPYNHSKSTYYYITNNNGSHKMIYDCCNAIANGSESCSGGIATCQERAVCQYCNTSYGGAGVHDYDFTVWVCKGADGHAHMCKTAGCTEYDTVVKHTSSGAATEDIPETCTECGYVINPPTGHINHTPAEIWSVDEHRHWKDCAGCTDWTFEADTHKYDGICDTDCSVCGYVREITHIYILAANDTEHWQECSACGAEMEDSREAHRGGKATCLSKSLCEYCYTVYGELAAHNYNLSDWGYERDDGHAHMCNTPGCDAYDTVIPHTSSGEATEHDDEICTVCGFIIQPAFPHTGHAPSAEWSKNETHHWRECIGCSQRIERAEHSYDSNGECICGAKTEAEDATHATSDVAETNKEAPNGEGCKTTIIGTPLAFMLVTALGCAAVFTKKRIK